MQQNRKAAPFHEGAESSGLSRQSLWFCAVAVIVLMTLAAYHNSFSGPFIFDDYPAIVENSTIRQLWPLTEVLSPPSTGFTVSGRPLVNLSLAINYAIGGTNVRGYHVFNLMVHLLAALALFGIVRRTLLSSALRERFGAASLPLAATVAVVWAVHPLQTESVTYVIQRAEALMGLLYLLTVYAFIRGAESGSKPWYGIAIAACFCGMATKEVMITAPLVVLLYDRTFIAGSFVRALRQRWKVYCGLVSSWVLLGWLVAAGGAIRSGSAGWDSAIAWPNYALTQLWAITTYLKLSLWPAPLVLDYGGPVMVTSTARLALGGAVVAALLIGTIVSLRRWPALGFAGAWFLGILALTSSVFPLHDTIFEHRVYLSLAAVVAVVVLLLYSWLGKAAGIAFSVLGLVCLGLTINRNGDYGNEIGIWSDTVAKRPENARAHYNLGLVFFRAGREEEALRSFQATLRLNPDHSRAHNNLAMAYIRAGRVDEAIAHFRRAIASDPHSLPSRENLNSALITAGRLDEAMREASETLRLHPDAAALCNDLGNALLNRGRVDEACGYYRKAIGIEPGHAQARSNLGVALAMKGRTDEAIQALLESLRINPNSPGTHNNLAGALEEQGRLEEAAIHYQAAARLAPGDPGARFQAGRVLAMLGRNQEAATQLQQTLRLKPDFIEARQILNSLSSVASE